MNDTPTDDAKLYSLPFATAAAETNLRLQSAIHALIGGDMNIFKHFSDPPTYRTMTRNGYAGTFGDAVEAALAGLKKLEESE